MNVFPEIKSQLLNIFERYRHVLDAELQQRACEFYALASRPEDDELLQNVCEEMPPFPPRVSALLGRLNMKHGDTEDKRTWIHGGKEANLDREIVKRKTDGNVAASTGQPRDILGSLAGLEISASPANLGGGPLDTSLRVAPDTNPRLSTGPDVDRWFDKLTYTAEGVLYEDDQLQIGIKSRYQGHIGQLAVYVGNKISSPL